VGRSASMGRSQSALMRLCCAGRAEVMRCIVIRLGEDQLPQQPMRPSARHEINVIKSVVVLLTIALKVWTHAW
jgi:hypothetical protein